jgi:hypothetical protein
MTHHLFLLSNHIIINKFMYVYHIFYKFSNIFWLLRLTSKMPLCLVCRPFPLVQLVAIGFFFFFAVDGEVFSVGGGWMASIGHVMSHTM